ncbi:MAG: Hsp20/alpha crystallin family protein [Myxococcota bacterium]
MDIDATIHHIEVLYRELTGTPFPALSEDNRPAGLAGEGVHRQLEAATEQLATALSLALPIRKRPPFVPPLSLFTTQDHHVFRLDLPGVRREDIELRIDGRHLTLSGLRLNSHDPSRVHVYGEAQSGRFERQLTLQEELTESEVRLHLEHGCLELHIPKRARAAPQSIAQQ